MRMGTNEAKRILTDIETTARNHPGVSVRLDNLGYAALVERLGIEDGEPVNKEFIEGMRLLTAQIVADHKLYLATPAAV